MASSPTDPETIGPYRLGERLGKGGMGEVYRGYDARLDRPVALKRVLAGVGDPELALRRFQREARAAARLRHPAIVQVHDWVETDDGAWLVMELVEGRPLREILRLGPLDPGRAVAITRDLLEGLAAAHEAGLVHRDLKAENVMVTPGSSSGRGRGEQAKILDFGLAKNAIPAEDETRVSMEGKLVGTLSAMSPEQVLGQDLDGRTDLFALGSLLYEALTGMQPFVGASAGETLNRVCTSRQRSVDQLVPAVPPSLSAFVDHLLEKDPRRRPDSAAAALDDLDQVSMEHQVSALRTRLDDAATQVGVPLTANASGDPLPRRGAGNPRRTLWALAAFTALLISGAVYWSSRPAATTAPIYVVVPETTIVDPSGKHDLELAASAIHTAIFRGLVDFPDVISLEVPPSEAEITDVRQLARAMAADEILSSRIECHEGGCRAELKRVDGRNGGVIRAHAFTIRPQFLLELSRALLGYLPRTYPEMSRRAEATSLEVRPSDYEAFLDLYRRFEQRDKGLSIDQLQVELDRLGRTSPRFLSIPILAAHAALQRFEEAAGSADLETARRAVTKARGLAADDPQVLMLAARAERLGGDLAAASQTLDLVKQLEPGNVDVQFELARLHEREGDIERALELALAAAERLPASHIRLNTASMLYRHGRFAAAREQIELGLELSPNSFGGLSRLAQLELAHGDLERAANLYARLVERSPEPTELINLGTTLMMLGRYPEAAESFLLAVEKNPRSPSAILSLADVTKLAGDTEHAATLYAQVLDLVATSAHPQRLASIRAQALAHLGRSEQAVAAIQEALTQQPDHPWMAYEAALVHILNGDRASAVWNARRALERGIEPRWFSLPWFDPLREVIDGRHDGTPER